MQDQECIRLAQCAYQLRRDVLDMVYLAGSGHIGGSFSIAELMAVLYFDVLRLDPSELADAGPCSPLKGACRADSLRRPGPARILSDRKSSNPPTAGEHFTGAS